MGIIRVALRQRACGLLRLCAVIIALHCVCKAQAPVLLTQSGTNRAIALEAISHKREPFALTSSLRFGPDSRTRIVVFAMNALLKAGERVSAFAADVQDASGRYYPLTVENAVPLSRVSGVTMVVLRLNDSLQNVGDVLLRIGLRGVGVGVGEGAGGAAAMP